MGSVLAACKLSQCSPMCCLPTLQPPTPAHSTECWWQLHSPSGWAFTITRAQLQLSCSPTPSKQLWLQLQHWPRALTELVVGCRPGAVLSSLSHSQPCSHPGAEQLVVVQHAGIPAVSTRLGLRPDQNCLQQEIEKPGSSVCVSPRLLLPVSFGWIWAEMGAWQCRCCGLGRGL